jgi:hypothetical protein
MSKRAEPQTMRDLPDFATVSVKTVARLCNIGVNQAYAAIARGEIPGGTRVGGRIVIRTAAFLAWAQGRDEK